MVFKEFVKSKKKSLLIIIIVWFLLLSAFIIYTANNSVRCGNQPLLFNDNGNAVGSKCIDKYIDYTTIFEKSITPSLVLTLIVIFGITIWYYKSKN